jgi:amphi-Trp domain-containing protein
MEKTLLKAEKVQSRDEVAAYLQRVVEKLQSGDSIVVRGGGDEVNVEIPDRVEFEVKVEEEADETSIEFELEWTGGDADADEALDIS